MSLIDVTLFSCQRELEQRAAVMGGGNFVLPVQTATDFMDRRLRGMSSHWFLWNLRIE